MIPARADSALGLVIEPHVLERAKVELYKRPIKEEPHWEQRINMAYHSMSMEHEEPEGIIPDPMSGSAETLPLMQTIPDPRVITSSTLPLRGAIDCTDAPSMSFQSISEVDPRTGGEWRTSHISGSQWSASMEVPSHTDGTQWQGSHITSITITSASSFIPTEYDHKNFIFKRTVTNGLGTYVYTGSARSNAGPLVLTDYQRRFSSRRSAIYSGSDVNVVDYVRNQGESNAYQTVIMEQRKYDNPIYSKVNYYYGPKDKVDRWYKLDKWEPNGKMLDHSSNARHSKFYYYVSQSSNSGPLNFGENGWAGGWNEGGSAAYEGMRYRFLDPTGSVESNHFIEAEHNYWQGTMMHFHCYNQPGGLHTEGNYLQQGQNHIWAVSSKHIPSSSVDARIKHGQRGAQAIKVPNMGGGSGSRGSDYPWSLTWLMKCASGSARSHMWIMGWNNAHHRDHPEAATQKGFEGGNPQSAEFGGYNPAVGIDAQGFWFLRDQAGSFWYPRHYSGSTKETYWGTPDATARLNGIMWKSGSNLFGEADRRKIGNKYGYHQEDLNHYALTYKKSGSLGILQFFVNGNYYGEQRKDVTVGANPYKTGSFYFNSIGQGYAHANGWTYGFTGSLGQMRFYKYSLNCRANRS